MNTIRLYLRALRAEFTKLKRSAFPPVSFIVAGFIACVLAGFVWIMLNPGMASTLGLIGQKATLSMGGAAPDWQSFVTLLEEMTGIGGLLFASIIVAWLFAKEYLQGTAKVLLVLPLPRSSFVVAKIIVATLWLYLLFAWLTGIAVLMASLTGLGSPGPAILYTLASKLPFIVLVDLAVSLPVAWIALASRGIFAPLGYAIGSLLLATMLSSTGWGPYAPWSVVAIISGAGGEGISANASSAVVVVLTGLLGLIMTIVHQNRADNCQ